MHDDQDTLKAAQRVLIDLVDDILRSTPGLCYELEEPTAPEDGDDAVAPYAVFTIETNPAHELSVVIDLAPNEFRFRINGDAYVLEQEGQRHPERWIQKRCRDVEWLVGSDLKIEVESLFGARLSWGLFARVKGSWREIADGDAGWGWVGLLGWLLPFGLSPLHSEETVYEDWFHLDGAEDGAGVAPSQHRGTV